MKHRIVIRCEAHSLNNFALKQQIAKCITAALDKQGVDTPCEINVLVTDDEGIRAINKAYRQIDKATDVLSFAMFELLGVKPRQVLKPGEVVVVSLEGDAAGQVLHIPPTL